MNHQNVCEKCDSSLIIPKECSKCGTLLESTPLVNQVASQASRIRDCSKCGFNFFVPKGLAEAVYGSSRGSLPQTPLSCLDLEWLFFAALDYQTQEFGGTVPSIDCEENGYKEFVKKYSVSRKNWLEIYWPPEDIDYGVKQTFMDLLAKYMEPQLWYAEYISDDEQELVTIEFQSALEIPQLFEERVRLGLIYMLDEAQCETYPWLIAPIKAMLSEPGYFSN